MSIVYGQTLGINWERFISMKIEKEDCLSIEEAMSNLGIKSKSTLYNYLNVLSVQRHRFPFDRKTYILLQDVERVRGFVEQNRG